MSVDKLVDSTQLDSDLTSVANAIRAKSGTSASLAFPADFVTAIGNISGGGSYNPHNLPSGYTEYEYIETTGTQYIDTGYVANNDMEIVETFIRTTNNAGYNTWGWGIAGSQSVYFAGTYFGWGSAKDKTASGFKPDQPFGVQTIKVNKSGLFDSFNVNRASFGTPTWTTGTLTIFLPCRNNSGTADKFEKAKIYYFAIYESGTKVKEFIPAMRNGDSVLGFYETVNGSFFTNAGPGAFVGGSF